VIAIGRFQTVKTSKNRYLSGQLREKQTFMGADLLGVGCRS